MITNNRSQAVTNMMKMRIKLFGKAKLFAVQVNILLNLIVTSLYILTLKRNPYENVK